LHCRSNPEADSGEWIPMSFNVTYHEIEVPALSMHSILSMCSGYDLKKYVIEDEEGLPTCNESGDLTIKTHGVEGIMLQKYSNFILLIYFAEIIARKRSARCSDACYIAISDACSEISK
jgi:hypothetical protein